MGRLNGLPVMGPEFVSWHGLELRRGIPGQ